MSFALFLVAFFAAAVVLIAGIVGLASNDTFPLRGSVIAAFILVAATTMLLYSMRVDREVRAYREGIVLIGGDTLYVSKERPCDAPGF